jgi:hypothetical protein
MCILFYPKSFGRTREFPSGGKKAYGWDACSSQGDKCQPWCMQIKPRQQVVKGVGTPFDPGGGGGLSESCGGQFARDLRVILIQRGKAGVVLKNP